MNSYKIAESLVDHDKALKKVRHNIFNLNISYSIKMEIEKLVEKWDGKKPSKRIATALNKAKIDERMYYYLEKSSMGYSRICVSRRGAPPDYEEGIEGTFQFSYVITDYRTGLVSLSKFRDDTQSYRENVTRAAILEEAIKHGELKELVRRWNAKLMELDSINEEAEKYGLEYIIHLES